MSIDYRCEVCGAKPGENCTNTIRPDLPLPGRVEHFARSRPAGRSKEPEKPNEAMCT